MRADSSVTSLKGIGSKTEQLLNRIGVYTVRDILLHYPKDYIQYKEPVVPEKIEKEGIYAVAGTIREMPLVRRKGRMEITQAKIGGTGGLELIWFRMPYIKSQLKPGESYAFYGKVIAKGNRYCMEQPKVFTPAQYRKKMETLQPVYGKTEGLTDTILSKAMHQALEELTETETEFLPDEILQRQKLCTEPQALRQIHFPDGRQELIGARRRLVFDEFFLFLLQIQQQKEHRVQAANDFPVENETVIPYILTHLPYQLTKAQKTCLDEIVSDMKKGTVMQRLIQGDVGSGKTIIAFLCMALMGENGHQSALMAPTEVLARQHYQTFTSMCKAYELDRKVILLTGSLTAAQKRKAYEQMQLYPDAMVIGTQALIQEKAVYSNLGLVITDEQHRFGVRQREEFAKKGIHPHILVMSATPIPRTLAIILYGDMDISVINEVPAKRLPNKNCVVDPSYQKTAYTFIGKEIKAGHQAYVICPLVEESEELDCEDVGTYAKKLEEYFKGSVRIGCLNGKMKPAQKNAVMEAFAAGEIDLLVSTTVVEVGVNVPNATVMMIENAERFGLAQLHQLRGRVGRGDAQSYCIMVDHAKSKASTKRLDILNRSNDGFFIASEDLKLRGPGDFFGIRQSGDFAFHIADIYQDADLLKEASREVADLLADDPSLARNDHQKLKSLLAEKQAQSMNL